MSEDPLPQRIAFLGDYLPSVRFELQKKELDSYSRAADFLNFNNVDVLCVQHEFGIYGGSPIETEASWLVIRYELIEKDTTGV